MNFITVAKSKVDYCHSSIIAKLKGLRKFASFFFEECSNRKEGDNKFKIDHESSFFRELTIMIREEKVKSSKVLMNNKKKSVSQSSLDKYCLTLSYFYRNPEGEQ